MGYFYAQVDQNGIVVGVSELHGEVIADHMVKLVDYDESLIGKKWDGTAFTDPAAAARPTLVITTVVADANNSSSTAISADLIDVTCPVGTVLSVTAELRDGAGSVITITDSFRMPLLSRDGREKVLLATLNDGVAAITAPIRESGVWEVTEASINAGLPEAMRMNFAGIRVFGVEI